MPIPKHAFQFEPANLGRGRFFGLVCLILVLPAPVLAEESGRPPEALLAHDSVAYFRFDGLERHRKAYDQTVLAEVMRGDLGDFGAELVRLWEESIGFDVAKERLLAGAPPEQIVKIHQAARQVPHMLEYLRHHGLMLGVEVLGVLPPRLQVTVVFPQAGQSRYRAAVFGGLQLVTELSQLTVRESKHGRRVTYRVSPTRAGQAKKGDKEADEPDVLALAWWQEGEHVVLTFGTEKPEHLLRRLDDTRRPGLTANPLFRSVTGFNRYESMARGFVDLENCVRKVQSLGPIGKKIIDDLGLAPLKSLTLHIGFAGRYQQTTLALSLKGKRQGVLKLIPSTEVSLDRLPPLPPDALNVTAFSLDLRAWARFARVMLSSASNGKGAFAEIDRALGIDFRKDLLDVLGQTAVLYNSPGEGLSVLGTALVIQVKDIQKLKTTLDTVTQSLVGDGVDFKKSRYRGVDLHVFRTPLEIIPMAPCWAVHDGWWVAGLNPAAVKGHILRSTKRFKLWKPPPLARQFLLDIKRNRKAKVIAFCVADVRASLKQILGFGQIFSAAYGIDEESGLDPSLLPHFQSVTEPLAPNVLVLVDEGDALRLEMKGSLPLPTDILGTDSFLFLALVAGLG